MTWEQAEEKSKPVLRCPLCESRECDTEEVRLSSRRGVTNRKLVLKIYQRCGLVLQFDAGRGIWNLD